RHAAGRVPARDRELLGSRGGGARARAADEDVPVGGRPRGGRGRAVKVVTAFPRPVTRIEHCWIPLPDGCRLAARVWLPEDAATFPVPAIVEYIPYRKRDFTRGRDEPMHHYFAGHGYAAVRVDVRGSGDSDGVLLDEVWLRHQRRDAYWRRADLERTTCAVYAVGGWADAYTNSIPRLLAGLTAPRKGLIGPWAHVYPHTGSPGPAIGFLQEALRWWDQWLKEIDTGVLDEPLFRLWMQQSHDGGRWVAEATWPSPRITPKRLALGPGRLLEEASGPETPLAWRSPQSIGLAAGDWCSFGGGDDAPTDQRDDDGGSLTFDSAPLGERLEILGAPVADLELAVDRPQAAP